MKLDEKRKMYEHLSVEEKEFIKESMRLFRHPKNSARTENMYQNYESDQYHNSDNSFDSVMQNNPFRNRRYKQDRLSKNRKGDNNDHFDTNKTNGVDKRKTKYEKGTSNSQHKSESSHYDEWVPNYDIHEEMKKTNPDFETQQNYERMKMGFKKDESLDLGDIDPRQSPDPLSYYNKGAKTYGEFFVKWSKNYKKGENDNFLDENVQRAKAKAMIFLTATIVSLLILRNIYDDKLTEKRYPHLNQFKDVKKSTSES